MDEEILRLLKENFSRHVSGEEISERLGVSRTAVWKRISRLRAAGYRIDSSPRLGYRFLAAPDLLTPLEIAPILRTKWMGKRIHYFRTIDSTNSRANHLASEGAPEGEVVIAEAQTEGRGRLGRNWFSPAFLNLYMSAILRPQIPPQKASLITLMAAVATARAVEAYSGIRPTIKWPNDILVGGRKLAGLLNEIQSETDRINFVILGIGVNLNMDETSLPEHLCSSATSLKLETGKVVLRKEFVARLLEELEGWYGRLLEDGGSSVLRSWRDLARIRGRRVRVRSFGETVEGEAVDVDEEGRLILKTEAGERIKVVAGDMEYAVN